MNNTPITETVANPTKDLRDFLFRTLSGDDFLKADTMLGKINAQIDTKDASLMAVNEGLERMQKSITQWREEDEQLARR